MMIEDTETFGKREILFAFLTGIVVPLVFCATALCLLSVKQQKTRRPKLGAHRYIDIHHMKDHAKAKAQQQEN